MHRYISLALLVILVCSAAACNSNKERSEPPPFVPITYEAQPLSTVVPGCAATDLESWNETVGTLIYSFSDEAKKAIDLQPHLLGPVLTRLIDLRDAIAGHPTPECAINIQSQILIAMRQMLTALQRYANLEISQDALREQINNADQQIQGEITQLLQTLQPELQTLLERENSQTPTPGSE